MVQCIPMTPVETEPGEDGGLLVGENKEVRQNSRKASTEGNVYIGGAICG